MPSIEQFSMKKKKKNHDPQTGKKHFFEADMKTVHFLALLITK